MYDMLQAKADRLTGKFNFQRKTKHQNGPKLWTKIQTVAKIKHGHNFYTNQQDSRQVG